MNLTIIFIHHFKNENETCAIDLEVAEGTAWNMKVAPSWTTDANSTMDVTDDANKVDAGTYTCTNLTDVSVRYEVSYLFLLDVNEFEGCWR